MNKKEMILKERHVSSGLSFLSGSSDGSLLMRNLSGRISLGIEKVLGLRIWLPWRWRTMGRFSKHRQLDNQNPSHRPHRSL